MTEEFLHYIWKLKLFNTLNLQTTSRETLEVVNSGTHNTDSGPDFFNARLKLNSIVWAGNIEVHLKSSDWAKHQHQFDKAYDNIILHVVYSADIPLYRSSGELIPTLELKDKIAQKHYEQYLQFKESKDWIPCEKQISKVSSLVINTTIDRLVLERLERKTVSIVNDLKLNNNNWEEIFYQHLARNFGFKVNAVPFEMLAKSLPHTTLAKHKNSIPQLEALLFGQAGFLDKHVEDDYLRTLQNEYIFLKHKFKLTPIDAHLWKFLRLRPVNFPTIRLAQFANLIFNAVSLFSKMIESDTIESLKMLIDADVSEYWKEHYVFDKKSKHKTKHLGEESINNIIINTIVPFLFIYGKHKNDEKYIDRALRFLEQIQGEKKLNYYKMGSH